LLIETVLLNKKRSSVVDRYKLYGFNNAFVSVSLDPDAIPRAYQLGVDGVCLPDIGHVNRGALFGTDRPRRSTADDQQRIPSSVEATQQTGIDRFEWVV